MTPTGGGGHACMHTTRGDYSIRRPTEAYCQPNAPRARASTAPNSTARRYLLTLLFLPSLNFILLCTLLYSSVQNVATMAEIRWSSRIWVRINFFTYSTYNIRTQSSSSSDSGSSSTCRSAASSRLVASRSSVTNSPCSTSSNGVEPIRAPIPAAASSESRQ
jgi:uncharacterized membrane protein YgcG